MLPVQSRKAPLSVAAMRGVGSVQSMTGRESDNLSILSGLPRRLGQIVRIATVNVRASGDHDRLLRLVRKLQERDCTTLVLTEFRYNRAGMQLEQQLIGDGFAHTCVSDGDARRGRGVLVASREPFQAALNPGGLATHTGALLRADFQALTIYGVYLPQKQEKCAPFDCLVRSAQAHATSDERAIAIGDFNTGNDLLDIERNRLPGAHAAPGGSGVQLVFERRQRLADRSGLCVACSPIACHRGELLARN
jgi:exonuclease III